MLILFGIVVVVGSLLLGDGGFWLVFVVVGFILLFELVVVFGLILWLYGVCFLYLDEVFDFWVVLCELVVWVGLFIVLVLYYVFSGVVNVFVIGLKYYVVIVLIDGLLCSFMFCELIGVFGYEIVYIVNEDLCVMGLVDFISWFIYFLVLLG